MSASTAMPTSTSTSTSAIQGVSVAEVRSALAFLRARAAAATPRQPVWFCDMLCNNLSVADFCTQFVLGQHVKRHAKSQTHGRNMERTRASVAGQSHLPPPAIGPKGHADDPFPFTARWVPKTQAGREAFGLAGAAKQ